MLKNLAVYRAFPGIHNTIFGQYLITIIHYVFILNLLFIAIRKINLNLHFQFVQDPIHEIQVPVPKISVPGFIKL